MKKTLLTSLAVATVSSMLTAAPIVLPQDGRGNYRVQHQGQTIDEMIISFMEKEQIPGLTLDIVQAPYIPRLVGYGLADPVLGKLASTKTLWSAGPISQAYMAVAVMQLFERDSLKLDDPVGRYVKGLPDSWQSITIYQLLQHTSGIADYRSVSEFDPNKVYSAEQLIASVADAKLAFKPGEDIAQSATNFLLLAEVVEVVSKMSYHDFVRKNQFEVLKLQNTAFTEDLDGRMIEPISERVKKHSLFTQDYRYINPAEPALGTRLTKDGLYPVKRFSTAAFKGFGDVWASAEDISFWDIGLAGGILIKEPANRALVYAPTLLANGTRAPAFAGWQFQKHPGLMDIQGGTPGFTSFLSRFTAADELVCVTLMANKEGVNFSNLARRIASTFGSALASGVNDETFFTIESTRSVEETVARLKLSLAARKIPVISEMDHQANAAASGLKMPASQVITFGAAKVGTPVMVSVPAAAMELPLRIAVWQDDKGSIWAAAPKLSKRTAPYGLADNQVIQAMDKLVETLIIEATEAY